MRPLPFQSGRSGRPLARVTFAVLFIFTTALLPAESWTAFAVFGVLLLAAGAYLRPGRDALRTFLCAFGAALIMAALALPQSGGVARFLTITSKSALCIGAAVLLGSSVTFSELLSVLRRLRIPSLLSLSLALTVRYVRLLSGEFSRLQRARRGRTFSSSRLSEWRLTSASLGLLFERTVRRGERVYAAMCARGWNA